MGKYENKLQDGGKIFIASADRQVRVWDLASNQLATVGAHDQPVKTCHWIKGVNYSCLMTGSWDKTLRVCITSSPKYLIISVENSLGNTNLVTQHEDVI